MARRARMRVATESDEATQRWLALPDRSTDDPRRYFSDPGAAYLLRRRFLCASPGANVFTLFAWGRLGPDDARELLEVLDAAARHPVERRQLVDLRQVAAVSSAALGMLLAYYVRRPPYLATVAREALVRPDGIVGIMAEGFYPTVPLPFERAVFRTTRDALDWLGAAAAPVERWTDDVVSRVADHASHLREGLEDLGATIAELGASAGLREVARHLGTTTRTLQRRLERADTSFRRERSRALVAAAIEQMGTTTLDLKVIAHELGFRSESRFSEHFRREVGESPQRFRAKLTERV